MSFERLQTADPATSPDEITIKRLRRRVLGSGASRFMRFPGLSVAASVTAFAVIAGGGVAIGRITAPSPSTNTAAVLTPDVGADMGSAMGGEGDAKSFMPWGGRVILNPIASMSDQVDVAPGFSLSPDGVDKEGVLAGLAKLVGASGAMARGQFGAGDTSITIGSNDGTAPVATIYDEPMLNFYAYNNDLSPWNCVRQEDLDQNSGKETLPGPGIRVCTEEDLKQASRADAERAFAQVLALIGLNPGDVTTSYMDTGSPQVIMISGTAKISGTETNMQQVAVTVSARGLFNVSGFASRFVRVDGYEIVGAKSAALRSQWSKWSALGPNPFGDWGVYPMARDGVATAPEATTGFTVDGRPGINAFIDTVDVSKARLGLVSYYSDGVNVLLPSWIFTAEDGRQWSMIALAEKYVKFTN